MKPILDEYEIGNYTSLAISRKLNNFYCPQNYPQSKKYWVKHKKANDNEWQLLFKPSEDSNEIFDYANFEDIPAYSIYELIKWLPTKISLCAFYNKQEYRVVDEDVHRNLPTVVSSSPCDALALMLIHLLENEGKEK